MDIKGDLDTLEYVTRARRDVRVYACEQSFAVFCMYYFPEFFTYRIAPFHWEMFKDMEDLRSDRFKYLLWVMFRESAKTSIAKMFVVYCILYRRKRFINYDSYDKGNAEAALFDVATWLQQNRRIIADFGQLYYEDARVSKGAKLKRLSEFVTANKVKVKAYSTQESTRGRLYLQFRPDLYIVDDFETEITARSTVVTSKVITHIAAMKAGLAVNGQIVFLGNLITESGSVAGIVEEAKENPGIWRYRRVDVETDGKVAWPDKYVLTNEEAAKINAVRPREEAAVSLEQKRRDLNAGGRKAYEAEMLNSPEASGDLFFDRGKVDKAILDAKKHLPIKVIGGFSIFEEYIARRRYAIGGDTSKGVSRDACADVAIRFSETTAQPAAVVGTYSSNTIAPDLFGDEMAAHGRIFGECLLAPELNNTGYATVTRLKGIYPARMLYRQVKEEAAGTQILRDLGWEATSANVATIYFNYRSAFEAGELVIWCPALLAEMRSFTKRDLEGAARRGVEAEPGVRTKHFDLLRAACIAWDMRLHAKTTEKKRFKQEEGPKHDYQG